LSPTEARLGRASITPSIVVAVVPSIESTFERVNVPPESERARDVPAVILPPETVRLPFCITSPSLSMVN